MKTLAVFGSTGSIGRNTLEVVRRNPDEFRVRYLAAHRSSDALIDQIREFRPAAVAVSDPAACSRTRDAVGHLTDVLQGRDGLLDIARRDDFETMVSSLVGFAGLLPTLAAIDTGRHIALANKETLVVAGEVISARLRERAATLTPIDSEHSAILQCIVGESGRSVSRIILTASGGPFRGRTRRDLHEVTREDALRHPNWSMGRKITIDSATMMNKGLEVIEARWLFDQPASRIDVIIHPQSVVHSLVEFSDGSVKAQLGVPDMKLPIHYALSYPHRIASGYERLDLGRIGALTFEEPDRETFRCLPLAYRAIEEGGTSPATLNAANEIAVESFLEGRIGFLDIPALIEDTMDRIPARPVDGIDSLIDADTRSRDAAREWIASPKHHRVFA